MPAFLLVIKVRISKKKKNNNIFLSPQNVLVKVSFLKQTDQFQEYTKLCSIYNRLICSGMTPGICADGVQEVDGKCSKMHAVSPECTQETQEALASKQLRPKDED
ncbi:hypothetical protein XENOCAPTIV_018425 [Xenoophorus captivus]|uniref:Uncharacterized protein n=1 Tax=Xenoophorus captivus TaxID=1517983 RepID=A0ABV0RR64_9TELE